MWTPFSPLEQFLVSPDAHTESRLETWGQACWSVTSWGCLELHLSRGRFWPTSPHMLFFSHNTDSHVGIVGVISFIVLMCKEWTQRQLDNLFKEKKPPWKTKQKSHRYFSPILLKVKRNLSPTMYFPSAFLSLKEWCAVGLGTAWWDFFHLCFSMCDTLGGSLAFLSLRREDNNHL